MSDTYTAALALSDGSVFWGNGLGIEGTTYGEVCFNTSMSGYQEFLTDPSYAGQIITFTFPHIGNVGVNLEDTESNVPAVRGVVLKCKISSPSSWRAAKPLNHWMTTHNLLGITGVDTRRLTRHIRDRGACNGAICHSPNDPINLESLIKKAMACPSLEGKDLASDVTCPKPYSWNQTLWSLSNGFGIQKKPKFKVVVIDFGVKQNILRSLAHKGCKMLVFPAKTCSQEILSSNPDGIFLSNGPGDPAATGKYAVPVISDLLETQIPILGICLGHQLLSLAIGASTSKMYMGHRGGNHPVQNLKTGKVEITTQNHGFVVNRNSLPNHVIETHRSLFDGSIEGIKLKKKPVFSVQFHPEASPGPHDSDYIFEQFIALMKAKT